MSTQDVLTDIYDSVQAVFFFLSGDLSREKLSKDSEQKRTKYAKILEELLNKIHLHQPAHDNRAINGTSHKPPPPPPSSTSVGTPSKPEPPIPDHEPTDYLAFEPAPMDREETQEVYEAMEDADEVQELYVDTTEGDAEEPSEVYEEPVSSRPDTANGSLPSMTPPGSQEHSGSGVEYMEANRSRVHEPDAALEWSTVYELPSSTAKLKVSQLEGISIKGPLEKLGGKNHRTWQKRYCVLAGPFMYFYEKENSKTFNNFINTLNFSVEYSDNLSNKKHFAFKLTQRDVTGKKKDYCFRSTSSENREKWITTMKRVRDVTPSQKARSAVTLPRLSSRSGDSVPVTIQEKRRSLTMGEEPQELYEPVDMVETDARVEDEEEGPQDDYVPVSPAADREDLESSEEYIDVEPHADEPDEVYEEPPPPTATTESVPPPPFSPPPGPPTDHPFPPSSSPIPPPMPPKPPVSDPVVPTRPSPAIGKKPVPSLPREPLIDTSKVYVQSTNGISLEKVFVSLWDFDAGEKDELNLKRGDLILVKDPKENADWWFGELLDDEAMSKLGKSGLFPRTYASHAFEAITS